MFAVMSVYLSVSLFTAGGPHVTTTHDAITPTRWGHPREQTNPYHLDHFKFVHLKTPIPTT